MTNANVEKKKKKEGRHTKKCKNSVNVVVG